MNVLHIYCYAPRGALPLRASVDDLIFCWKRHAEGNRVWYVNSFFGFPKWIRRVKWDVILFNVSYLSQRWDRQLRDRFIRHGEMLRELSGIKVVLPQDEFVHTDILCDFVNAAGIDWVYTCAAECDWPTVYNTVDRTKVRFRQVLTGYLEDQRIQDLERVAAEVPVRDIDVAYRAWKAAPWLGRHGQLKVKVGELFAEYAPLAGFHCDISTSDGATLYGNDWYRWLLRSRYTVGVEGGASILDRDGSLGKATAAYEKEHPGANFDEIEAACFPGRDGELHLFALSPRHLEACLTRTCQVLVEGSYNGVLEAGRHYISVKSDFSNLPEVLEQMKDESGRLRITENAWQDIVASGKCSYRAFTREALTSLTEGRPPATTRHGILYAWCRLRDALHWKVLRVLQWRLCKWGLARLRRMTNRPPAS